MSACVNDPKADKFSELGGSAAAADADLKKAQSRIRCLTTLNIITIIIAIVAFILGAFGAAGAVKHEDDLSGKAKNNNLGTRPTSILHQYISCWERSHSVMIRRPGPCDTWHVMLARQVTVTGPIAYMH